MANQTNEPLYRAHLYLYARDWERVKEIYGSTIGASAAVREILRKVLTQHERATQARLEAKQQLDSPRPIEQLDPQPAPQETPTHE